MKFLNPKKLSTLCLITAAACPLSLIADASIDETTVEKTIVVDQNGGGDFTTISEAFQELNRHPDLATKVFIQPGIYRERAAALNPRTATATIIEGVAPGEVIITGSDIWEDWNREGEGLYSKEWPFDWGLAEYNPEYYKFRNDLGKRCEIVMWDGERLTQVAAKEDLHDGSFFADEENDTLWMQVPTNGVLEDTVVEVGVRPQLLWFRQVNNLVLRNLTVTGTPNGKQHGNDRFNVAVFGNSETGDMNTFDNVSRNLLIENCAFIGNNSGPTMTNYEQVTIRNTQFNDNGTAGLGASRFRYVDVVDCEFNENNWRIGGYGLFYDWAPAGVKFLKCADMNIRDSVFNDNLATGLWLDFQMENITVNNIQGNNNAGPGIYMEASSGPFVVTNSEFMNNGRLAYHGANHGGVLIAESRNVTISNCRIIDNSHSGLMIRTRPREGCGGYYSGKRFGGSVENITFVNNIVQGKRIEPLPNAAPAEWYTGERLNGGLIMDTTFSATPLYKEDFLKTLYSDGNTYYHDDIDAVFSNGNDYGFERISFEEWQEVYGHDVNSRWEPID